MDLNAYELFNHNKLEDYELPEENIQRALKDLEALPKPTAAGAK